MVRFFVKSKSIWVRFQKHLHMYVHGTKRAALKVQYIVCLDVQDLKKLLYFKMKKVVFDILRLSLFDLFTH
jgi:hypothetical protein